MPVYYYEEQFKYFLKRSNLKYTKERKEVLKAITILQKHFHAEDIHQQIKKQKSSVSLATVYRTVPLLVHSGLITETLYGGGRVVYEKVYNKPHHDHLICLNCGKIIEFTYPDIEKIQKNICQLNSFLPTEHRLEIKGYCQICQKKLKDKKRNKKYNQEF